MRQLEVEKWGIRGCIIKARYREGKGERKGLSGRMGVWYSLFKCQRYDPTDPYPIPFCYLYLLPTTTTTTATYGSCLHAPYSITMVMSA